LTPRENELGEVFMKEGKVGCGDVVSEDGVVYLVDEDAEEGASIIARVGLGLRLGLGDRCGDGGGK
jgi:hypothetical protein